MADSRQTDTPADPLIGKTLAGRYLVQSLIDRGGMGKVYQAEQKPLGRLVALKTLDLLDPRGEFKERFFNEASIASKLTHPNTVRIFDYGRSEEGTYFITMELLRGQSLQALVKREAPLESHRLIHMMRQVCGALQEAHENGIVHRDLKPGNIFLTPHGDDFEFAKVLDFGLVKNLESDVTLSQTGQALGSPLYMSPEQVEGDTIDRRADIYGLGLVMYVATCGMVPFKKGSVATIMMQQVTAKIPTFAEIAPTVKVHPALEWIVRRCIEKDRNDRFASMRDLSLALKLADKEIRGELPNAIPWALDADGHLDLPKELIGIAEETWGGSRASNALLEINDVPSSPTLNRGNTSIVAAAGGAAAVTSIFFVFVILGVLLIGAIAFAMWPSAAPPDPVVHNPVSPPEPPAAPTVEFKTDPSGAEVMKGGLLLGTSPLPLTVSGAPIRVTLHLDGYESREVLVDGTVPTLTVRLRESKPPEPSSTPIPTPAPVPIPTPVVVPTTPRPSGPDGLRHPWEDR